MKREKDVFKSETVPIDNDVCVYILDIKWEAEAARLNLHTPSVGREGGRILVLHWSHAATTSSLTAKCLFFFFLQCQGNTKSPLLTKQEAWWRRRYWSGGTCIGGFWDTNRQSVQSEQHGSPYAMQTRVLPDSLNRRLASQGWWGSKQDSEEEEEEGGLEEQGNKCTAGWMTSALQCFRFSQRQHWNPLPIMQHSLTTRSQHGSRQKRVVGGV